MLLQQINDVKLKGRNKNEENVIDTKNFQFIIL